jgi:predicted GNAT family N-acyltransferase
VARKTPPADYGIEPLGPNHDRSAFCCGVAELDRYIQNQAGQDLKRKLAAVFILTHDGKTTDGFYTLSAQSILASDLSSEIAKKLPRYPLPVTLLGRMAVAQSLHGLGLGEFLLLDALARALRGSRQVASWAVVVDTKAGALDFYLGHGFIPLATDADRLFLPMRTIEEILAE